ncbi:hypothetical protein [Mycobacteroides abscessus]|uniref:hypothetical protein n=1 Tax=Mycobacteroides abscessus TaxID=36809 RepID=UPI000C262C2C|nr:hypothetical protein [Mycobacteroides abscessus]RIR09571.1 hypothetical protein D2E27_20325 [Mycobacteroides abscessus]RIS03548.1 hypothetical protein D2E58_09530 [Mycobacteroides abscessus]
MHPPASSGTVEVLEQFHTRLHVHFTELATARSAFDARVFALEHGLPDADLVLLQTTVRASVVQGFQVKHQKWWLPFLVYAAEAGYVYNGKQYWQTFAEQTPLWYQNGDRDWIRAYFVKFAETYAGVVPRGAFADAFGIIAWPIANAVLPTSLHRDLARLLYEFQFGLTPDLLSNPVELGRKLGSRAGGYTEQFRIFCSSESLLGAVAAALLSGEGDGSPYLIPSMLSRLVMSFRAEQKSRLWLDSARGTASRVRTHGFVRPAPSSSCPGETKRLPAATDPKLSLKRHAGGWRVHVSLPDLSVLSIDNTALYDEMRHRRGRVDGAERPFLPHGWLLNPGLDLRLERWPRQGSAFLQLEEASAVVNDLLATRCVMTPGPAWLFRRREPGVAVEIKGKVVRPGVSYTLVVQGMATNPRPGWITDAVADIEGVSVLELAVPSQITDADIHTLRGLGLTVVSDVTIRPVGLVASAWDGEGSVEWLAGERGLLAIGTQLAPVFCLLTLDGQQQRIDWKPGQRECFLLLDDLGVGTHELGVTLTDERAHVLVQESLIITIRDPQARPDAATPGEGIRMLASPAHPSISDLFDGRATLTVDGPTGATADLLVSLHSELGEVLTNVPRPITLPMSPEQWSKAADSIRSDVHVRDNYDAAESARVVVSRAGVGFASIKCDRGFRPLRWRVAREHSGSHVAYLIDRTDHASTVVELFTVEQPLVPVRCTPDETIAVPALGGLLRATAGDAQATTLLPTQPMQLLKVQNNDPTINLIGRQPDQLVPVIDAVAAWAGADLPGDPFAARQQDHVLTAITRKLVTVIANSSRWTNLELRLARADDLIDHLEHMQAAVGVDDHHKALAKNIASHLWEWAESGQMLVGFDAVIAPALERARLIEYPGAARFLLLLAGKPWHLASWDQKGRAQLLRGVTVSPVLIRAARFAVLGARALKKAEENAKGF